VLGPDGKPVEGARLYCLRGSGALTLDYGAAAPWPAPQPMATTGPDGAFRFAVPEAKIDGETRLLAMPPGVPRGRGHATVDDKNKPEVPSGIVWQVAWVFDSSDRLRQRAIGDNPNPSPWYAKKEAVLRLVKDDVPLVGRVLNAKGEPVAGAMARVVELWQMKNEDLTGFLRDVQAEKEKPRGGGTHFDRVRANHVEKGIGGMTGRVGELGHLLAATTDREGRLRLNGIGRERIVYLAIEGRGIQTLRRYARTRPGPAVAVNDGAVDFTFYGSDFEHTAPLSVPVVGTIRDRDSGEQVAGVMIQSQKLAGDPVVGQDLVHAVTDAQGHYQLTGLPVGKDNRLLAIPIGRPYLLSVKEVEVSADRESVQLDWQLKRGVWIRGQVCDVKSGTPLQASVQYFVFRDNPQQESAPGLLGATPSSRFTYRTDKEGRYAIAGLPGRGIVGVWAGLARENYPEGAGAGKIQGSVGGRGPYATFDTYPERCVAFQFHALAEVDVPEGAESFVQDFQLDPGETLRGKVLDPEGRPLSGANCNGITPAEWKYLRPLNTDDFLVKQYFAERPRLLLFVHKERKLAGSLILRGPQKGPLTVRLQPWGTITGRVLDAAGKAKAEAVLRDPPRFEGTPIDAACLPEWDYVTDKDGRFRIEGLAPDVKYNAVVHPKRGEPFEGQVIFDVTVTPGETKDLGDLPIKPFRVPGQ
jgi:hypothetical protein